MENYIIAIFIRMRNAIFKISYALPKKKQEKKIQIRFAYQLSSEDSTSYSCQRVILICSRSIRLIAPGFRGQSD